MQLVEIKIQWRQESPFPTQSRTGSYHFFQTQQMSGTFTDMVLLSQYNSVARCGREHFPRPPADVNGVDFLLQDAGRSGGLRQANSLVNLWGILDFLIKKFGYSRNNFQTLQFLCISDYFPGSTFIKYGPQLLCFSFRLSVLQRESNFNNDYYYGFTYNEAISMFSQKVWNN